MTGIFSNDTYNNGVTRDNFEQYAHTFDSNARYDNIPIHSKPAMPTIILRPQPKESEIYTPSPNNNNYDGGGGGNNNNNNNNKSNTGKWAAIIIVSIIIFGTMFAVNLYYNMQDLKYFEEKKIQAENKLNELQQYAEDRNLSPEWKKHLEELAKIGIDTEGELGQLGVRLPY